MPGVEDGLVEHDSSAEVTEQGRDLRIATSDRRVPGLDRSRVQYREKRYRPGFGAGVVVRSTMMVVSRAGAADHAGSVVASSRPWLEGADASVLATGEQDIDGESPLDMHPPEESER